MNSTTQAGAATNSSEEARARVGLRRALHGCRLFLGSRTAWFVLLLSLTATIIAWDAGPSSFIVSAALFTLTASFRRMTALWRASSVQSNAATLASMAAIDRMRQVCRAAVVSSEGAASLMQLLNDAHLSDEQRAALAGVRASVDRIRALASEPHGDAAARLAACTPTIRSPRIGAGSGASLAPMFASQAPVLSDLRTSKRIAQEMLRCNLGEVVDLSLGGMRVRTPRRSSPPTGILSVELRDVETPITVRGEVVRLNDLGGGRYEAGIRFVDLTPELTRDLTRVSMLHRKRLSFAAAAA